MTRRMSPIIARLAILALGPACATGARADLTLMVSLDTSSLVSQAGTFSVDFQLNPGNGVSGTNSATLNSFTYGGGAPHTGTASTSGDVQGTLDAGSVILRDDQPYNEFIQDFTPGRALTFLLDLTTDAGMDPDTFTFSILQDGSNIPTTNAAYDSFLEVDLASPPTILASSSVDPDDPIPAPTVTSVPEPSSLILSISALVPLGMIMSRPGFGLKSRRRITAGRRLAA